MATGANLAPLGKRKRDDEGADDDRDGADPLAVVGRAAPRHDDVEAALLVDAGKHLRPWHGGDAAAPLLLDRFDVRNMLERAPPPRAARSAARDDAGEAPLDAERYRDLPAAGAATVAVDDGEPADDGPPSAAAAAAEPQPWHVAYSALPLPAGVPLPATLAHFRVMVATARRVVDAPQLEVLLRVREGNSEQWAFLQPEHALQPLYEHLKLRAATADADWPDALPSAAPAAQEDSGLHERSGNRGESELAAMPVAVGQLASVADAPAPAVDAAAAPRSLLLADYDSDGDSGGGSDDVAPALSACEGGSGETLLGQRNGAAVTKHHSSGPPAVAAAPPPRPPSPPRPAPCDARANRQARRLRAPQRPRLRGRRRRARGRKCHVFVPAVVVAAPRVVCAGAGRRARAAAAACTCGTCSDSSACRSPRQGGLSSARKYRCARQSDSAGVCTLRTTSWQQ